MKAYHFHNGRTLRDGRPLPPLGQKLVHSGPLVLCESGLHFSGHPFDALQYAPGSFLDIVPITNKQRQQFISLVEAVFAEADPRAGAMDY